MNCRLIDDFDELSRYAAAWDRLAEKSEFPNVFISWGFNAAWWRAFNGGKLLRVIVVIEENNTVRLIAPFYAENSNPRSWKVIADFSGDYNDLIVSANDYAVLDVLFSWLIKQGGWDTITIGRVASQTLPTYFSDANHPEADLITKLRSRLSWRRPRTYRVWNHEHPHSQGDDLLAMSGLLTTKNYVRHVNWFKRSGDFRMRTTSDPEEIRDLMPKFMALHTKEWQKKDKPAQFNWPLARNFFMNLTEDMKPYGTLRMNLLEYNHAIVAAHFGFADRNRFYFYKPCFDPYYSHQSPGKLLMAYMIQNAIDCRLNDFDFLRGIDSYKERYAKSTRRTAFLQIYPPLMKIR